MKLPKVNQYIQSKGSKVLWKVWALDNDSIALAHNQTGAGKRITHGQFEKNWKINR